MIAVISAGGVAVAVVLTLLALGIIVVIGWWAARRP